MPRIRHKYAKNYTMIDNEIIVDVAISYKARGIFLYLWHLSDDWEISLADIQAHSNEDGQRSVRTGVAELEQHGYVTIKRVHGESTGRFTDTEWVLDDRPSLHYAKMDNPKMDNPTLDNAAPLKDFPGEGPLGEEPSKKSTQKSPTEECLRREKPPQTPTRPAKVLQRAVHHFLSMPGYWQESLVKDCLMKYYAHYQDRFGRKHPAMALDNLSRYQITIGEAFERHEVKTSEQVTALVDRYWLRTFDKKDGSKATDGKLAAFATAKNLNFLAWQEDLEDIDQDTLPEGAACRG